MADNPASTPSHSGVSDGRESLKKLKLNEQLYEAVDGGDTDTTRELLALGADPNHALWDGFHDDAVIHVSARAGYLDILKMLLEKHCDVNKNNGFQRTALHVTAQRGHAKTLELLLQHGADVNTPDILGRTPLLWACKNARLTARLIEAGADVNHRDTFGVSTLADAASIGNTDTARELLRAGARVNATDLNGCTALMMAAKWGHYEMADLLLKSGAAPAMESCIGMTAIHEAAGVQDASQIIRRLLEAGVDPNVCNWRVNSPIVLAIELGKVENVKVLVLKGNCRVDFTFSLYGRLFTPLQLCLLQILELVGVAAPKLQLTGVEKSEFNDHLKILKLLLASGVRVHRSLWAYNIDKLQECARINRQTQHSDVLSQLKESAKCASSLRHRCRQAIRVHCGKDLATMLAEVPLPLPLKDFIMITNLDNL